MAGSGNRSLTPNRGKRERRLGGCILDFAAFYRGSSRWSGRPWLKVACQRSLMSPRNRPALVSLLCTVIGWDKPEGSDTGGGSQLTAAGVSFASHSWRFAR